MGVLAALLLHNLEVVGLYVMNVAYHRIVELLHKHKLLGIVVRQLLVCLLVALHVRCNFIDLAAKLLNLLEARMTKYCRIEFSRFGLLHLHYTGSWQRGSRTVLSESAELLKIEPLTHQMC